MANTVFLLGAGASKRAGAPLMYDFLDVAHDLWKAKKVDAQSFETVFKGISALQQVHSKSMLDIYNVEAVFAAFEMAKTFGRFATYTMDEIEALIVAMRDVIVRTIDATIKLPVDGGRSVLAPAPYPEFTKLVNDLRRNARPSRDVAILTFNYDICSDFALYQAGIAVDYALGPKNHGAIPLLKLHGSLNWASCDKCKSVVAWEVHAYLSTIQWNHLSDSKFVGLPMGAHIQQFEHCDEIVKSAPVIVPPTWNKTEHQRALASVWRAAAHELSEAEDIFVIGYSLPESDAFFRYLFALGTVGETPLRRFWVFNPDESGATELRYRELLGPGAEQRFRYIPKTFIDALPVIREAYHASLDRK